MSYRGDPPSAGTPLFGQQASGLLSAADAERLIVRHWANPEAPREQHLLAALFERAAAPSTDRELTGEAAAVAAFVLAASGRAVRARRSRRGTRRRTQVIAAGIVAASVMGFSVAAAADVLPGPVQELAHQTFGAPAPGVPGQSATLPAVSGRPGIAPGTGEATTGATSAHGTSEGETATDNGKANGQGQANGQGNGNAQGKGNGQGQANGQGSGNAQGKGNGQGQANGQGSGNAQGQGSGNGAAPSGQQKQSVTPSPGVIPSPGVTPSLGVTPSPVAATSNLSLRHAEPRHSALAKRYEPCHAYPSSGHRPTRATSKASRERAADRDGPGPGGKIVQ